MDQKRLKVGIALGTGAARGFAHIGVLKALQQEGIPIDFISGTSMGALIGGCFAAGLPIEEMERLARAVDAKKLRSYFSPSFTRHGIAHGRNIEDFLRDILGDITFEELKIPLSVMCTDLMTGKEIVLNSGPVVPALRASISLPVIFTPVRHNGFLLVDGGLVDPLPASAVAQMGADVIIAVDVTRNIEKSILMAKRPLRYEKARSFFSWWKKGKPKDESEWTPGMFQVLLQTIKVMEAKLTELQLAEEKVDILLKPALDHILFLDFKKAHELILLGEESVRQALPEIRKKVFAEGS